MKLTIPKLAAALLVAVAPVRAAILTAECVPQADNVLRYDCSVTTSSSAEVWIEYEEAGSGEVHATETTVVGMNHGLTLWGLKPSTHYDFAVLAQAVGGPLDTRTDRLMSASLPAVPFDSVSRFVTAPELTWPGPGGGVAVPLHRTKFVLMKGECAASVFLYIVNHEGDIVWYQDVSTVGGTSIDGFTFTDRGTVAAILGRNQLVEWSLAGEVVKNWTYGSELTRWIHHDLVFKDGRVYVLTAEPVTGSDGSLWVSDGVQVFDRHGDLKREWSLRDAYDPAMYGCPESGGGYWSGQIPGHADWTHANSLWVDRDKNLYISLRSCHRVLKLSGAPASFGDVLWTLGGDPTDLYGDFIISSSVTPGLEFRGQHNAWLDRDGTLRMFDNYGEPDSRALRFRLDESAGTAEIISEHDLALGCRFQGSAYRVEENVLASCHAAGTTVEMNSIWGHVWKYEAECGGAPMGTYRAVPINSLEP